MYPHSETKGLLEVREIGIMTVPYVENVKLTLVVELVEEKFERLPRIMSCNILGMKFPKIKIFGKSSSAVAKIKIKLNQIRSYVQ